MTKDQEKKKEKIKPKIFVDTNFLLDVTEGRNDKSIYDIEKIRIKKWPCMSSALALMEVADIIKDQIFVSKKLQGHWTINRILRERYKKDLNLNDFTDVQVYIKNKILGTYNFIQFLTLSQDGWQAALEVNMASNISTSDAIQLITAWSEKCDILLTSDQQFIEEGKKLLDSAKISKPRICTPAEFDQLLEELKFE